jgi:hypothetical protein
MNVTSRHALGSGTLIVSYSCPNCRAQLEAELDGRYGWMRCPVCRHPALPPQPAAIRDAVRPLPVSDGDVTSASPLSPDSPIVAGSPAGPQPAFTVTASHNNPARLIFLTGLVLSLVLGLISFLDQQATTTFIFGFLAFTFFVLLLRTARRRTVPWTSWPSPEVNAKAPDPDNAELG